MKAIAAMSQNGIIGNNGTIPWRCSEDLKWFKEFTLNKTIVVGRKTFEGLPPLKNRNILVLSNSFKKIQSKNEHRVICDLNDIPDDAIIAGGGEIYNQLLPYCSDLYLTIIKKDVEGDTTMPTFIHLFPYFEELQDTDTFSILHLYNNKS